MKIKKEDRTQLLATIREGIAKAFSTSLTKGIRKSQGSADAVVKEEKVSISKYLRGVTLDDWSDAEVEKALYEKALGQDTGTRGGVLVPELLQSEIIPLLKETAVVRAMPGVRTITLPGSKLTMNRIDASTTISWGAENTTITEDTTLEFGNDSLELKKAVCLYKTSRELIENANTSIDALVRQDLAEEMALEEDVVILQGTGGQQPLGIYYHPRIVSTDISASPTFDTFKDAIYNVRLNTNAELTGWIGHPRTAHTLGKLKDGNGRYIFAEGSGQGVSANGVINIEGAPFRHTTKVSIVNRPAATESYVVGGRWSELLLGDNGAMRIEASSDRYFELDQIAIRLVRHVGSVLRQPGAFVVVKGLQA